jgi:hypothetical protein
MADRDENGRFVPGWHGGPGRPPKEESVTDLLRATVSKQDLVNKLVEIALEKGDKQTLMYCIDRLDGKPKETVHNLIGSLPDVVEIDLSGTKTDTGDVAVVEEREEIPDSERG